jgi:hypothetical protein
MSGAVTIYITEIILATLKEKEPLEERPTRLIKLKPQ